MASPPGSKVFAEGAPPASAVVLVPRHLLCSSDEFINAAEASSRDVAGRIAWSWQELPDLEEEDASSTVRDVLERSPEVDAVVVPSFDTPFQATYYTRVTRGSSDTHSTTHVIPPYRQAYDTSVALCNHFNWRNIVILNSDDHFMSVAQALRQKLSTAGLHVRRHQVFSSEVAMDTETSARRIEFELEAIQSSGVRVVFLLTSCASYHAVLSTARRLGMLRGYAWILLHPPSVCPLASVDASSDVTTLETYQGVLGLAWSGELSDVVGNPLRAKDTTPALQGFCGNRVVNATAQSKAGIRSGHGGVVMRRGVDDQPDFSGRFLYDSLMLFANRYNQTSLVFRPNEPSLPPVSKPAFEVGVSVVSFLGARRKLGQGAGEAPLSIEALVQSVARIDTGSSGGGRRALQMMTGRPIRWPGDVHVVPKDLVPVMAAKEARGSTATGARPSVSPVSVAVVVAVVCIALTPLWNFLFKKLRRPKPPPCQEGCGPVAVSSLPDDKESQAQAMKFIEKRMAELSDKQVELMRSVEVDMQEVQTKSVIGSGSFSYVYKGYYASSHIAIKVLKKVDEKNFRRFLDEIVLHKDLRHPNVIPFRGASWSDGRLLLIIDYAGRGTLSDVLRRSNGSLKWKTVKLGIATGIAKGMAFLHQARFYDLWTSTYQQCIVHRDLKPQNILITDSYHVQITDFGEARTLDRENTMTQVGTQLYAAPEVVRGERYSEKCDLYSFAVVLVAMLELKPDVLDVFAEYLNPIEKAETGITAERLKEPEDVEATDQCKTCPLNKQYHPPTSKCGSNKTNGMGPTAQFGEPEKEQCPLAKHREFKGVVAHAVTRAVVYDDMRPRLPSHVFPTLRSLIERCWDKDAAERPAFKTVVDLLESEVLNEVSEYTRASEMRRQRGEFELTRRRIDPLSESISTGSMRGSGFLAAKKPLEGLKGRM